MKIQQNHNKKFARLEKHNNQFYTVKKSWNFRLYMEILSKTHRTYLPHFLTLKMEIPYIKIRHTKNAEMEYMGKYMKTQITIKAGLLHIPF